MPSTNLAYLTCVVEAGYDGINQDWVDITSDVLISDGVRWNRGMSGLGPTDRCAASGRFTCTLRSRNVAAGNYAPEHVNCPSWWYLGTRLRVTIGDGQATRVVFYGRVREIVPGVGPFAAGMRVRVTATDWLDDAAEMAVAGVAIQIGQRGDQILTALLAEATIEPTSTDFDTGDSTFPYALDNVQDGRTRLLQVLAQVAASECGYIYLKNNDTLAFEKRTARQTNAVAAATFDNTMTGFELRHARGLRPSKVRVTVHPRVIDAAATTVLFKRYDISAGQTALELAASATVTVFGPYGDPNNGNQRCGGSEMVTPAATTDYLANTAADGTGTNKTAQLGVTASYTANGVSLELVNNDAGTIYVTLLQCRGKGIYNRDAVVVTSGTGDDEIELDMPFEGDSNVAQGVADSILDLWGDTNSCALTYTALTLSRIYIAVTVDVGDRVFVAEDASGVRGEFVVQSVAQHLGRGPVLTTTYGLVPANEATYWLLDDATYGKLEDYSRLGF